MPESKFPKSRRLLRKAEFDRVFAGRVSAGDATLVVYARHNELNVSRLGLAVSRKIGGAVERNRVKRLLREAFRLSVEEIPGGLDLVVVPRGGQVQFHEIRRSLLHMIQRVARKLAGPAPGS